MKDKKQLVIGITGASGAVYAIRLLELLKAHPLRGNPPNYQSSGKTNHQRRN